jgi:CRP-like cAMP-binding protein
LRDLLPELPVLSRLLERYMMVFMERLAQTIACNSLHSVEQRCTRWILTAHDLVGSDEFHLTHEMLAMLLGVRRAGVTVSALVLQRAGLIAYSRGRLIIRDRAGLEEAACECHSVSRTFADKVWREAAAVG